MYFIAISLLLFTSLFGELALEELPAPPLAENHPIWHFHNQPITIRGFWYPLDAKDGILAAQPHLKSCCVGASHKISQQLLVKEAAFSPNKLVTLKGIFHIEPVYNQQGQLIQLYVLTEAQTISKEPSSLSILVMVSLALLTYFAFLRRSNLNRE